MSVFPQIAGGLVTSQRPYISTASFLHTTNEMDCGVRYAYSWRANPIYTWTLTFPHIPTTDVKTLEDFFNSMAGRYGTFSFTDIADGSTHTNCRFDQDTFAVMYNGVNDCAVVLKIAEFAV
jgi:hypothetical protein